MSPGETVEIFNRVAAEVSQHFGNLSAAQLNWKPSQAQWSIAQCLHHLMVSNSTYYPQLRKVVFGKHHNSFYQNIRFISDFFGQWLIKETGPVVNKPMKNPPLFNPAQSDLPASVIDDFNTHQQNFVKLIKQLESSDLKNTVISSPALKFITYNLNDLLTILAGHEQRHLNQAIRVKALL